MLDNLMQTLPPAPPCRVAPAARAARSHGRRQLRICRRPRAGTHRRFAGAGWRARRAAPGRNAAGRGGWLIAAPGTLPRSQRQRTAKDHMLEIAAVCLVITALLAYLNHRYLGLPGAIGMMAASLALSLALVGLDAAGIAGTAHALRQYAEDAGALRRLLECADAGHAVDAAVRRRTACRPQAVEDLPLAGGGTGRAGHDAVDRSPWATACGPHCRSWTCNCR